MNKDVKTYYNGIDALKGLLVIVVFLGHVLSEMSFAGHIIYSFHMPLFICVSGFLVNVSYLSGSVVDIAKKYWWRMVLPWMIAVPVYYFLRFYSELSVSGFLQAFVRPYRHLWYVPAICFYIAIMVLVVKVMKIISKKARREACGWWILFGIAVLFAVLFKFNMLELIHVENGAVLYVIEHILEGFRPQYFLFFVIGAWIRDRIKNGSRVLESRWGYATIAITVVMAGVYWTYYRYRYEDILRVCVFYAFNIGLCYSMLKLATNEKIPRMSVLEFMGRYSLPIYLYHFMGRVVSLWFFEEFSTGFYVFNTAFFVILIVLVYLLKRVAFIDKYIFGNNRER